VVVHALKEHEMVVIMLFYDQFLWFVHDGEADPQLVFLSVGLVGVNLVEFFPGI
jgi:hypothetical protein